MQTDFLARDGVAENLRFLTVEVGKQLDSTLAYLAAPSKRLLDQVLARDDYIDNIKAIIQRKSFVLAPAAAAEDDHAIILLQGLNIISGNLERIGDFCENVVAQVDHVRDRSILQRYEMGPLLREAARGVAMVDAALLRLDTRAAAEICRIEARLDDLYARMLRRVLEEVGTGGNNRDLITVLLIAHYFERMGDALQNIGEAIISAAIGERIKIDQLEALEASLEGLQVDSDVDEIDLTRLGETRSGCRIDRVTTTDNGERSQDHEQRWMVFKEGRRHKLIDETTGSDAWNDILPGLAPRIYSLHDRGENAAILTEYLPGLTFEQLQLRGDEIEIDAALRKICDTLHTVWDRTRSDGAPLGSGFMEQLLERLEDVYAVHPTFSAPTRQIGPLRIEPFDALVQRVAQTEKTIPAPFTVFIHGDFNIDNIIYNDQRDSVHFIDLHRSTMSDYTQDVSVFIVSNLRLQGLSDDFRARTVDVATRFLDFASSYATAAGDETFEARTALGLARSLVTSARFVLDSELARSMLLRSRYLLEKLAGASPAELVAFRIPRQILGV